MPTVDSLYNLPEISFVEKDLETLLKDMIADYENAYYEQNGERKTLQPGDPIRIWIYSQALRIYQAYQLIDFTGKMNLLKYSERSYLDNIGTRVGVTRLSEQAATATVRFTLSTQQNKNISIPIGTRVSPGNNIFFVTTEYKEVASGQMYVDIPVECSELGTVGNGFTAGQIKILVDPIPYVSKVENLDNTQGGSDIESDDSLKERIFMRPESFSVAGPEGAYEYFTKEYSSEIADVKIDSPSPGTVDIRVLLSNGQMPTTTFLQGLQEYLSNRKRRPLTDNVTTGAPSEVSYNVDVVYYILDSDREMINSIKLNVEKAINNYVLWQKQKIGRDINPDELRKQVMNAGAKRLVVHEPIYTNIQNDEIAIGNITNIIYGGIEDD